MNDKKIDMNRDPITNEPGSHPLGTGTGATGGAAAGAILGGLFGPIGMVIGGSIGAVAGGGAGHAVAERVNPTGELEYWRSEYRNRDYTSDAYDFDRDYRAAYELGWESRTEYRDRDWDDKLEADLKSKWEEIKDSSELAWEYAKAAVRDAWDRTDNTYQAYESTDRYFEPRYADADYFDSDYTYQDYSPAYRYGTFARKTYSDHDWDDQIEEKLESSWEEFKGESRLAWNKAKHAARDAWHSIERTLPGDFDNDGR